jgi:phosphatidylserine decarboxylase
LRQIIRILLTALPKVALSRVFGFIARTPVPVPLRGLVYRTYALLCGADLREMQGGPGDYRSLAEFFQRPLRDGVRPIDDGPVIWPCDGRVISAGPITAGRIEQIKGIDYSLEELLVDRELAAAFATGTQATIYLAPGDYHRVHAPFAAELLGRTRVPGTLFPTNPPATHSIRPLYPRNERVVHRFRLEDGGAAALVMVGALNVGDIHPSCPAPCSLRPGEEIARFGLGSTAILLLPRSGPAISEDARGRLARWGGAVPLLDLVPAHP